jgi:hypothetical protein
METPPAYHRHHADRVGGNGKLQDGSATVKHPVIRMAVVSQAIQDTLAILRDSLFREKIAHVGDV